MSSSESDFQCFSPGNSDDSTGLHSTIKFNGIEKTKRLKASARERKRRHVLNDALEALRMKVSGLNQNPQKLSKIEVLRHAIYYIRELTYYLETTSPILSTESGYLTSALQQQQILMQQHRTESYNHQRKQNYQDALNTSMLSSSEFDVYLNGQTMH